MDVDRQCWGRSQSFTIGTLVKILSKHEKVARNYRDTTKTLDILFSDYQEKPTPIFRGGRVKLRSVYMLLCRKHCHGNTMERVSERENGKRIDN